MARAGFMFGGVFAITFVLNSISTAASASNFMSLLFTLCGKVTDQVSNGVTRVNLIVFQQGS